MCLELIEFAGMTQAAIAQTIGYTQAGMSRVVSGGQRSIRYESGKRIEALYAEKRLVIEAEKRRKLTEIRASLKAAQ